MIDPRERAKLEAAANGDGEALGLLLEEHRSRLRRMVELRLDPRIRQRVDASDVLQEAFLDVARQLPGYLERPHIPVHLWLRMLTGGRLLQIHRRHLGSQKRDARLELRVGQSSLPAATSAVVAHHLVHEGTSPSEALVRQEESAAVEAALEELKDLDREILALRHLEQLTNGEVALLLGLSEQAASARYVRAVQRLSKLLPGD